MSSTHFTFETNETFILDKAMSTAGAYCKKSCSLTSEYQYFKVIEAKIEFKQ